MKKISDNPIQQLSEIMKDNGMKPAEMSRKMGMHHTYMSVSLGRYTDMKVTTFHKCLRQLGMNLVILTDEEIKEFIKG